MTTVLLRPLFVPATPLSCRVQGKAKPNSQPESGKQEGDTLNDVCVAAWREWSREKEVVVEEDSDCVNDCVPEQRAGSPVPAPMTAGGASSPAQIKAMSTAGLAVSKAETTSPRLPRACAAARMRARPSTLVPEVPATSETRTIMARLLKVLDHSQSKCHSIGPQHMPPFSHGDHSQPTPTGSWQSKRPMVQTDAADMKRRRRRNVRAAPRRKLDVLRLTPPTR